MTDGFLDEAAEDVDGSYVSILTVGTCGCCCCCDLISKFGHDFSSIGVNATSSFYISKKEKKI